MSQAVYTDAQQRQLGRVVPDLIRSRGLLLDLVWKDLRALYRNAIMGFVWAVLQPVLMMLILMFVFGVVFAGRVAAVGPGQSHPYSVFLLCGLIFWQFFAACLSRSTTSLLDNHDLVKKVYFPREVIPLAAMGICTVNLAIGFVVLVAVHLALGQTLGLAILWLPGIFAIQLALTIGLALLCACLNVRYRDVGYMVEVALTFGFYATPIFYSLDTVREKAAAHTTLLSMYLLNPMVGIITAYRQAFLDNQTPDPALLAWPAVCAAAALLVGAAVFRRSAAVVADSL